MLINITQWLSGQVSREKQFLTHLYVHSRALSSCEGHLHHEDILHPSRTNGDLSQGQIQSLQSRRGRFSFVYNVQTALDKLPLFSLEVKPVNNQFHDLVTSIWQGQVITMWVLRDNFTVLASIIIWFAAVAYPFILSICSHTHWCNQCHVIKQNLILLFQSSRPCTRRSKLIDKHILVNTQSENKILLQDLKLL